MYFLSTLIFGLCSVALVSGRGHGFDKRDNGEYGNEVSTCLTGFYPCIMGFIKYDGNSPAEVAQKIKEDGIEEFCNVVTSAQSCASGILELPDCKDLPEPYDDYIRGHISLGDFVCGGGRKEDIAEHWDCLLEAGPSAMMTCKEDEDVTEGHHESSCMLV